MRLGVYFDGFSATRETLEVCKAAEAEGADSFWFAQHMGYRDALTMAAAAGMATSRAALVPTAITPYLWPALPVAMTMATLDEIAPGRARIAVSVGNLLNLGESGGEAVKPVKTLREYVEALRRLWRGEAVHMEGEVQKLRGAHMEFGKDVRIPIYIASTGPKVLHLAGEITDGVLLSAGMTLVSCRRCLDAAEQGSRAAGRDPGVLRKAGFINFNVSRDGVAAKKAVLRKLAFLFRNKKHADNIKSSGLDIDHDGIIAALSRRDLDAAAALLPLEAADVFGVAGTPEECGARLEAYLKVGLTEPIIEISGSPQEQKLALDVVRELVDR